MVGHQTAAPASGGDPCKTYKASNHDLQLNLYSGTGLVQSLSPNQTPGLGLALNPNLILAMFGPKYGQTWPNNCQTGNRVWQLRELDLAIRLWEPGLAVIVPGFVLVWHQFSTKPAAVFSQTSTKVVRPEPAHIFRTGLNQNPYLIPGSGLAPTSLVCWQFGRLVNCRTAKLKFGGNPCFKCSTHCVT